MPVNQYSIHDLKNIYLKLYLETGELKNKEMYLDVLRDNQDSQVLDPNFKEKIKKILSQHNIS